VYFCVALLTQNDAPVFPFLLHATHYSQIWVKEAGKFSAFGFPQSLSFSGQIVSHTLSCYFFVFSQATEDGYRLAEELATAKHTKEIEGALQTYYRKRIPRTTIIQVLAQLGSDLLVDFDKMMTIPLVGPFFLFMTQVSMPFILRFLYTPEF